MKLDDYLVTFGRQNFEILLGKAVTFNQQIKGQGMTNEIGEEILVIYTSPGSRLTYEAEKYIPNREDKVKIFLKVIKNGKIIFSDMPNISSEKIRVQIARKCASRTKIESDKIEDDLQELETLVRIKLDTKEKDDSSPDPLITEEDKKIALDFLKTPNLIDLIVQDIRKIGVIGEESNALMVYFLGISRIQDKPISIIYKGSSSSGKSHVVSNVLKLFPPSEVLAYSHVSAKALVYKKPGELKHKVLFIYERPGAEDSDYNIRAMQSEHKLKISVTVEDKLKGGHKTKDSEVQGPIAYIETTTKKVIHAENETRGFSIYADETIAQTKEVFWEQKSEYRLDSPEQINKEAICIKHIAAQKLLQPYKVKIPYIDLIEFPATKTRFRRDHDRFLTLIACSALLNQYQRTTTKDGKYIVADFMDYKIVYDFFFRILESLSEVPPKSRLLLKICQKIGLEQFSRKDIETKINWPLHEINPHMQPLVSQGFVEEVSGSKGQRYTYRLVKGMNKSTFGILSPEQLQAKIKEKLNEN